MAFSSLQPQCCIQLNMRVQFYSTPNTPGGQGERDMSSTTFRSAGQIDAVRATVVRSRVPMCERDDWGFHTVYRDLVQLGSGALEFRAPIDGADHAEGKA
jgi:hypothetical protein